MLTLHNMVEHLDCDVDDVVVTVRLGDKWADSFNKEIELCVCREGVRGTHSIEGHGRVTDLWCGSFKGVPARLIEKAQQISSRSYTGCKKNMERAYPNAFSEDAAVTVVTYHRID